MNAGQPPIGVLLIQLGTPDSTDVSDVRRYLREFLSDPRVIDLPVPARTALLEGVILPFRPRRSAEAYEKIWTDAGSPLLINTTDLARKVADELGSSYAVTVGMRYQNPSIEEAVDALAAEGCIEFVVVPLFPQYSSAATGSAVQKAVEVIGGRWNVPAITTVGAFYDHTGYIDALAASIKATLDDFGPDHLLFSYHGLPEKQIRKSDPTDGWCLESAGCCDAIVDANRFCYRAQCFATTRAAAGALDLSTNFFSTTFQSRLAGQKWIKPYTDKELPNLYEAGVRRLAVVTPSFTADCLETIEEIGIRGRAQWHDLGSDEFFLVPCLNADDPWVRVVAELVRNAS